MGEAGAINPEVTDGGPVERRRQSVFVSHFQLLQVSTCILTTSKGIFTVIVTIQISKSANHFKNAYATLMGEVRFQKSLTKFFILKNFSLPKILSSIIKRNDFENIAAAELKCSFPP